MSAELTIRTLSADVVRSNLNDLIAVAADVPGEYWTAENFLVELPQKWRLSFAPLTDDDSACLGQVGSALGTFLDRLD